MATDQMPEPERVTIHPGDIVQDQDGLFLLVTECHPWGLGAVLRWREGQDVREHYYRLRDGSFRPAGVAPMLPPEVAQARRDSLAGQREIEREAGHE